MHVWMVWRDNLTKFARPCSFNQNENMGQREKTDSPTYLETSQPLSGQAVG